MVLQVSLKKTADIWRCHHWFPGEMTSENRVLMTHHFPDLGSASDWLKQISHTARSIKSAWNFCARFSGFISRRNQWCRRKMLAVYSCYFQVHCMIVLYLDVKFLLTVIVLFCFSLVAPKICKTALCYEISKGLWYLLHYL